MAGKFLGLNTAQGVAHLVSSSFMRTRPMWMREGPDTSIQHGIFSGFFRLLGLDSTKLGAIALNAIIFIAQLVSIRGFIGKFIHSLLLFNFFLVGAFYMTHASRASQSHDLSGEGINFGSHTYFFDHTRTWMASPDERSAQCWGHLLDNTNIKDDTHHSLAHSF